MSTIHSEPVQAPNVGDALQRAWVALKPNIWIFLGFTFLFFLAYYLAGFLLAFIPFGSAFVQLVSFIYPVSLFNAFELADGGREVQFGDFFRWTPRFGRLLLGSLVAGLALLALVIPLMVVFGISMMGSSSFDADYSGSNMFRYAGLGFGFLSLAFIIAVVYGIVTFALQFLLLKRDLPLGETLSLSVKTGFENLGTVILFFLLAVGLVLLGLITCGLGLLITVPLILGTQYFILLSIFPDTTSSRWDFEEPATTPDTPYQSF